MNGHSQGTEAEICYAEDSALSAIVGGGGTQDNAVGRLFPSVVDNPAKVKMEERCSRVFFGDCRLAPECVCQFEIVPSCLCHGSGWEAEQDLGTDSGHSWTF